MLTREEIIRMARDAGFSAIGTNSALNSYVEEKIACFAAMVAAAEREACAKVCDSIEDRYQKTEYHRWPEMRTDAQQGAGECAAAIRARGEKGGE